MFRKYDIIVIGGGHAGCEAALASANLNSKVLLITMNMQTIGQMSCNPAMGGIAKGQIVREIDALGGYSGIIADKSTLQFRMLNKSKGPAMWSPRSQNDRFIFAREWRKTLENNPNIDFWQDSVKQLIVKNNIIKGVVTNLNIKIESKAVIVATGTFLNGLIHIGNKNFGGGRMGDKNSCGLTENLKNLGFCHGRMKTGTPVRVDGRTVDFKELEEQKGDDTSDGFSFLKTKNLNFNKSCFITYTNNCVHEIIKKEISKSPMYNGTIKSIGPRYCPSIEDKVMRFSERDRHRIFLEPEGIDTYEMYVNGFSSSLPEDIQYKALQKIPGFNSAKIFRPGYAIEYDFFFPTQLKKTLETKKIQGLYFAGQINGTTGYEEAACQGLLAGINANLKINDIAPLILKRSEAYIGVLIDDLVLKGTDEPYRMFTSRAEYRILLRQDNADIRLTEIGYKLGLATDERYDIVKEKIKKTEEIIKKLDNIKLGKNINDILKRAETNQIIEKQKLSQLLKRPQLRLENFNHIEDIKEIFLKFPQKYIDQAIITLKYEDYIKKEKLQIEKTLKFENLKISPELNYKQIKGFSNEGREKLWNIKPTTLGEASRISGVSSSDLTILRIYLGR